MHRHEVVSLGVRHRPDDRQPVHLGGELGQVLADPDPGDRRVDRVELAADAVGGLGLHVEGVVLPESAAQQDHDHRLRPADLFLLGGARLPGRQQAREPHPQQAGIADLEDPPPRHPDSARLVRVERAHVEASEAVGVGRGDRP
jgi:hypothetical protein